MKNILFLLFLFAGLASCKKQYTDSLPVVDVISDSVLIDGHYRTFHYLKPSKDLVQPSLIFILHGSGGTGKDMLAQTTKLEQLSKNEKLLLVYPDGYKKFWNGCRKMANTLAKIEKINENLFFDKMIFYFKNKFQINKNHIFAIGVSGGGDMAYKLALTMPDQIKGITAIIANLPDTNNMDCATSRTPVPVLIANGTADPVNPYNGGLDLIGSYNMGYVRSTDQTFKYWAAIAGYTGIPTKETVFTPYKTNQQLIERYKYSERGKPDVVLLKVIGGKHELPKGIDIFIEAWGFFKKQMNKTNE